MERRNFMALTGLFTLGIGTGLRAAIPSMGVALKVPASFTMEQYHHVMQVANEVHRHVDMPNKASIVRSMLEPVKVVSIDIKQDGYVIVYNTPSAYQVILYKDKNGQKTKFHRV